VFEEFTEQARQAVVRAQEEARMMGHGSVEAEHVLLGLFSDRDGIPGRVFADVGLTIETVRDLVRERLGPGSGRPPEGHMPFSPGAREVFEGASRVAFAMGAERVATEHLLGAFTRPIDGGACQILRALDVDPGAIRFEIKKRVQAPADRGAGPGRSHVRRVRSTPLGERHVAPPGFEPALADPVAQRLFVASARIALGERRTRFGLRDVLRAAACDEEISRLLADLGVELDVLRERLDTEPPAAD